MAGTLYTNVFTMSTPIFTNQCLHTRQCLPGPNAWGAQALISAAVFVGWCEVGG